MLNKLLGVFSPPKSLVLMLLKRSVLWPFIEEITTDHIESKTANESSFIFEIHSLKFQTNKLNKHFTSSFRNLYIQRGEIRCIAIHIAFHMNSVQIILDGVFFDIQWKEDETLNASNGSSDLENQTSELSTTFVSDLLSSQWSGFSDVGGHGDSSPLLIPSPQQSHSTDQYFKQGQDILFKTVDTLLSSITVSILNVTANITMPNEDVLSIVIPHIEYADKTDQLWVQERKSYVYSLYVKYGFFVRALDAHTENSMKSNILYTNGALELLVNVDSNKNLLDIVLNCVEARLFLNPQSIERLLRILSFVFKRQHPSSPPSSPTTTGHTNEFQSSSIRKELPTYDMNFTFTAKKICGILLFRDQNLEWEQTYGKVAPKEINVPHVACSLSDLNLTYKSSYNGISLVTRTNLEIHQIHIFDEVDSNENNVQRTEDDSDGSEISFLPDTTKSTSIHIARIKVSIKLITLITEGLGLFFKIQSLHRTYLGEMNHNNTPQTTKRRDSVVAECPNINIGYINCDILSEDNIPVMKAWISIIQSQPDFTFDVFSARVELMSGSMDSSESVSKILSISNLSLDMAKHCIGINTVRVEISRNDFHTMMPIFQEISSVISLEFDKYLSQMNEQPKTQEITSQTSTTSNIIHCSIDTVDIRLLKDGDASTSKRYLKLLLRNVHGSYEKQTPFTQSSSISIGTIELLECCSHNVETLIISQQPLLAKPFQNMKEPMIRLVASNDANGNSLKLDTNNLFVDICIENSLENIQFLQNFFLNSNSQTPSLESHDRSQAPTVPSSLALCLKNSTIAIRSVDHGTLLLFIRELLCSLNSTCHPTPKGGDQNRHIEIPVISHTLYPSMNTLPNDDSMQPSYSLKCTICELESLVGPPLSGSTMASTLSLNQKNFSLGFISKMTLLEFSEILSLNHLEIDGKLKDNFSPYQMNISNGTLHVFLNKKSMEQVIHIAKSISENILNPKYHSQSTQQSIYVSPVIGVDHGINNCTTDEFSLLDESVETHTHEEKVLSEWIEDDFIVLGSKPLVISEHYFESQENGAVETHHRSIVSQQFSMNRFDIFVHLFENKVEKACATVQGLKVEYLIFQPNQDSNEDDRDDEIVESSSLVLSMSELEIHDTTKVSHSTCKLLSKYVTREDTREFAILEMNLSKDVSQRRRVELQLDVVPIMLTIHEHAVDFFMNFLENSESESQVEMQSSENSISNSCSENLESKDDPCQPSLKNHQDNADTNEQVVAIPQVVFEHVNIEMIEVHLTYYPSAKSLLPIPRIENACMNFTRFSVPREKPLIGQDQLVESITQHVLNHFKNPVDLFKLLLGLRTVKSLYNIAVGASDLIVIPLREYQKDGGMLRGVQMGIANFLSTVTVNTTQFTAATVDSMHMLCTRVDNYLTEDESMKVEIGTRSSDRNGTRVVPAH
ncbi:hypothetical protein C9374_006801 [Naegleria lovaniensis]|uniref:Autophagy-related protein 2 n=1 Tax=Naegleria lovaniensis TaxID=51637 RepID=A0AA88H1Z2_NAELO|nr:uncharacterized protein C9374_006801 [Naegleria lovaniensis]KAG2393270.1 hypothetical protein C9374_006801 [Naegleria lovaniensis]